MTSHEDDSQDKTTQEIALIIVRGKATARRVDCEIAAISQVLKDRSEIEIVVCEPGQLEATLSETARKRIWVHVAGHGSETTSPPSQRGEQILHLQAADGRLELKRGLVSPPMSFADMLATLQRANGLELAFFNASETKQLANGVTGVFAFGWASSCLEQGAIAFATAFYSALHANEFARAFATACARVARGKTKLALPVRGIRCQLADPDAWIADRKRKREIPLEAGLVPGIGRTKLDKLGKHGITTVQALAQLDPEDDALVDACRSRDTLRKWRDSATCQLMLQQRQRTPT